mgnify:FL=1
MEKIDLHIHTTCSDGVLSPYEVIDEAYKNNVKIISITDHDTISAYTEDLIEYAKKKGIKLIPGIEISTKSNKCGIHVLGYNIDINNKEFSDILCGLRSTRHKYLYDVSKKLESVGFILDVNTLDKIDAVTKAHIANDVINNKNNKDNLIKYFNHIPNKGEFIETIMNEGCPCYVKKETITPSYAADIIRKYGGKPVLAHPVAYKYEDNLSCDEVLKILKSMDCHAIEGNYVYVDRNNNKINEVKLWNKFAIDNALVSTIGSDFHASDGIRPIIGLVDEEVDANIDDILNYIEG